MAPFTIVSLWDVHRIFGDRLAAAGANSAMFAEKLSRALDETSAPVLEFEALPFDLVWMQIGDLELIAKALDMPATLGAAHRITAATHGKRSMRDNTYTLPVGEARELVVKLGVLNQVVADELAERRLYALPLRHAGLFEPNEPPFGKEVEDKFPLAAEDVSEAGKCLAVGRYTATVFHLMRAMECAVQALAKALGVAKIDKGWGKLLSDIGSKVEAMPKGQERDQWSEVHANLYHVKQAWRNNTMHPKQTYTDEEAGAVYEAVRAFMKDLARQI